jgi:tRNA(His) guanylyltransferase
MSDQIGARMKSQYEDRTRYLLPRRTHTILRIDGKAFHTFTRGCAKPFDYDLMDAMDTAAIALCREAMGVRCGYGQSDEYSFLLTDFDTIHTESWFDGNIQKIVSVAASIFTESFPRDGANFDARIFTIPDQIEVQNYFVWRQQDATRNAILMAGYANFSPKQMHGKNTSQVQEMLFRDRQINFNDYPVRAKRGRVVFKENYMLEPGAERSRWVVDNEMPILTADRSYFYGRMRFPMMQPEAVEATA